jgi:hypothetical protein
MKMRLMAKKPGRGPGFQPPSSRLIKVTKAAPKTPLVVLGAAFLF